MPESFVSARNAETEATAAPCSLWGSNLVTAVPFGKVQVETEDTQLQVEERADQLSKPVHLVVGVHLLASR